MEDENRLVQERIRKLKELEEKGINPYPYSFDKKHNFKELQEKFSKLKKEEKTKSSTSTAGRIILLRRMGKVTFATLQDTTDKIQVYFNQDELGKEKYKLLKKVEMGDFLGVKGLIFKTRTGEVTVNVKNYEILSKSLRPLPEKYHGLQDKELRYRQRYLDLIMNPEVLERFKKRTLVIKYLREFLDSKNFMEVETPVLQVLYGGTNAKPFKTKINAYSMDMYLRVAPELYLKRLVVGGIERVYEIAKNFRNEGVDQTHNPEFTMVEWYEAYADYNKMMDRAEECYKYIAKNLNGNYKLKVGEKTIDISKKWPRMPLIDSLKKYAGLDVKKISDKELEKVCKKEKIDVRGGFNRGKALFALFDKLVAPELAGPIWIVDYPIEVSPLAKTHRKNPELVERFECYIGGKEIGDGWSEIISPIDQRKRFENEQKAMRAGDDEAHPMDEDFLTSLEYGMPPLGGIGIGIDRLVMLFTNCWSIRDVLFFPIMKPEK